MKYLHERDLSKALSKLLVGSCCILLLHIADKNLVYAVGPVEPLPAYRIGSEDVLDIVVWKNADLSKTVIVRPDGMISLPLIGDTQAAGLTPNQLRDSIVEKLKEYQQTVVVSVIVQGINSFRVFILGEVMRPGIYILKTRTTLVQAIALAGGFNQFASKNKIVIIREKSNESTPGEKISVNFDDIVNAKSKSDKNVILRPGDTIFVP